MLWPIWSHSFNFKNVKNTYTFSKKLQARVCIVSIGNTPPQVFITFVNCTVNFILPYHSVPLSVRMPQYERQVMTFIKVLPVHVDPHINKHSKSESERKRKNQATRKSWLSNTKQNECESSLFINRAYANETRIKFENIEYSELPSPMVLGRQLQSFTKYLRLTLVFMRISVLRETFNFCFSSFFASINKIFILAGRLNAQFPKVLSCSATREATRIYHVYK